jgi:hypothetical protein
MPTRYAPPAALMQMRQSSTVASTTTGMASEPQTHEVPPIW